MAKPALGRGLGALLGGNPIAKPQNPVSAPKPTAPAAPPAEAELSERVKRVPLDQVRPCPFQPRKEFSAEALRELADSIKEQGILQPLIVRQSNGHLEIIAGERRWRAAQLVGLLEIPVIVRKASDDVVLELALIENLQRENLNPLEEAQGYNQLLERFALKQEEIALKVGKSRASIANSLRLLKLPASVQGYLRENQLSVGHAKVLLGLPSETHQKQAADRVIRESLNVRQTEELVSRSLGRDTSEQQSKTPTALSKAPDAHLVDLENRIRERLGTKISLRYSKGKGSLEISFFSDDELHRVLEMLGIKSD